MRRLKTLAALTAAALLCAALGAAPALAGEGGVHWLGYQAALAAQKKQAKPLLVYFHLPYCYRCKEMKRKTFSQPRVVSRLNHDFIVAQVDLEQDSAVGEALKADYTPSYLFFNAQGQEVFRAKGVMGPQRFLKLLTYVSSKVYQNQTWEQYRKGD